MSIQSAYNRWSKTYDSQPNPTRDMDAAVLDHILPNLTGLTVVEAGCGTGKNSGQMAANARRLIAFDFSEGMMAVARQKHKAANIFWARCDLNQAWPLIRETADLVIFNLVLEHIEHLEPVFAQAARVLRSDGSMILSEFHPIRLTDSSKGARITGENGEVIQLVGSYRHIPDEIEWVAAILGLRLVEAREWFQTDPLSFLSTTREKNPPSLDFWLPPPIKAKEQPRPLLLTMRFQKSSHSQLT